MTPSEKNILKSLVAVAWADGNAQAPETAVIDSLLWAFGANGADEAEIKEFAKKKRTIKVDVPLEALKAEDRELLLAHAALITHADGKQTKSEQKLLQDLGEYLGFSAEQAGPIIAEAKDRADRAAGI